ncbi:MAG: DUF4301 family protein [Rikenellaceae bacterium]
MFTTDDLQQIESYGIDIKTVEDQIDKFCNGFPFLNVEKAAVNGEGILINDQAKTQELINLYQSKVNDLKIVKFIPASGAATRMFKDLYSFLDSDKMNSATETTIDKIQNFAFYKSLKATLSEEPCAREIIEKIIEPQGLEYGSLPKALIEFHNYEKGARTAFEEHFCEGAQYAASKDNAVNLHFTVSPEHKSRFVALAEKITSSLEAAYGVKYNVSYSEQLESTNTIAVNNDNTPFRNSDGTLLFRPAGHGALIANLDAIDADLIFIKNIDNVAPDSLKADTIKYKKILAGTLLEVQGKCFDYLNKLDQSPKCGKLLKEIEAFIEQDLMYKVSSDVKELEGELLSTALRTILERPIRVCGMVRNEGEAGGGPFWVLNGDGSKSLQIAEPSQIAPDKAHLLTDGTHFNPVDLVCATKNYKGEKYELQKYVDPQTGFISGKSKDGRELKALELPGLWNGAMSNWNTLFVEVPVSTFSPVKSVVDLLRPQHQ